MKMLIIVMVSIVNIIGDDLLWWFNYAEVKAVRFGKLNLHRRKLKKFPKIMMIGYDR